MTSSKSAFHNVVTLRGRYDESAFEALVNEVQSDLRSLAASKLGEERRGDKPQAAALVHEAWVHLVDTGGSLQFENRAHFFTVAAEAMRRILVDHALGNCRDECGGDAGHAEIDGPIASRDELLAVHKSLDRLMAYDPCKGLLVKLRYFAGLSFDDVAGVMGTTVQNANRDWAYARAWLHSDVSREARPIPPHPVQVISVSTEPPREPFVEPWTETWTRTGSETWTK